MWSLRMRSGLRGRRRSVTLVIDVEVVVGVVLSGDKNRTSSRFLQCVYIYELVPYGIPVSLCQSFSRVALIFDPPVDYDRQAIGSPRESR